MAQGRGNANRALVVGLTILCILAVVQPSLAATTHNVGGVRGWTLNAIGWPKGKIFRAGDTLVFKYSKSQHNVVRVSALGYSTCKSPTSAKPYPSGYDRIKLVKGPNYFICSIGTHCKSNMKIAVIAI